jgi:hypothetical protein
VYRCIHPDNAIDLYPGRRDNTDHARHIESRVAAAKKTSCGLRARAQRMMPVSSDACPILGVASPELLRNSGAHSDPSIHT